ncbi:MAG TPA: hypothetical protein VF525_14225 [Pyrinomonadaceae bacterium]|jgi:YD repeat-containing protein
MKYLLLLFGTMLLGTSVLSAQTKTDRASAGLIGPVRSVRVEAAKMTSSSAGQLVEGARLPVAATAYDEQGNVTEQSFFSPDGTLRQKIGWQHTYDAAGREVETIYLNDKGLPTSKAVFTYDEQGRLTEMTLYNPNGAVNHVRRYTYDEQGNKIREIHRNQDGTARTSMSYLYDARARLTETNINKPDGTLINRNAYTYDEQGRESGWTNYAGDGTPRLGVKRTYDDSGNLIEILNYAHGNLSSRETLTYELDARGNWIKCKVEREAKGAGRSQPEFEVRYRTITYF